MEFVLYNAGRIILFFFLRGNETSASIVSRAVIQGNGMKKFH